MTKHTPGPWTIEAAPEYASMPCGGVATVNTPNGLHVAVVCDVDSADARLIAAAPDLLEALRCITAHYIELVETGDCGYWNPNKEESVILAHAAIEKAIGEQP